jgi:chemotaxis protein MotA
MLASLWHLFERPFESERARAEIARDVEAIRTDGVLRARPMRSSDTEITTVTEALIHDRSLNSLIEAHDRFRRDRLHLRQRALRPIRLAGEMAPVFGMAGTLFSLSQMNTGGPAEAASMSSIGLAVITTLYGLLAAHLLFHPLASLVERRASREEADRQLLIDWMARQLAGSLPSAPPRTGPRLERVV